MLTRRMLREDAPEVVLAEFGMPLRTFVLVCSAPVLAVHKAALTATAYAGLPASVWQDLAQPILTIWRASIRHAIDSGRAAAPTLD